MNDITLLLPQIDELETRRRSLTLQMLNVLSGGLLGQRAREEDEQDIVDTHAARDNPDAPADQHPVTRMLQQLPFAPEGRGSNGGPLQSLTLTLPNAAQYVDKERRADLPPADEAVLTVTFDPSQPICRCFTIQMFDPLHLFGAGKLTIFEMHHEEHEILAGTSVLSNVCDEEKVVQCSPDNALKMLGQISAITRRHMEKLNPSSPFKALISGKDKLYVCCDTRDAGKVVFAGQSTGHTVDKVSDTELYALKAATIPSETARRYVNALANLERPRTILSFTPRAHGESFELARMVHKLARRGFVDEMMVRDAGIACDVPPPAHDGHKR